MTERRPFAVVDVAQARRAGWRPERDVEIEAMVRLGKGPTEIGRELKLSPSFISRTIERLRQHGWLDEP
jgi:transposase-like protein